MKRRFRVSFLLLAGILLAGIGLAGLASVRDVMQYAVQPSAGNETSMTDIYEEALRTMAAGFPKLTLHGVKADASLGAEGNRFQNNIMLYAAGPSWHEVYPMRLRSGRPIMPQDTEQKAGVIVLDEQTARDFFGNTETDGKTVELGGKKLEVVGVAEHSRRIGETGEYAAWVPLDQVKDCDLIVLSVPAEGVNRFPVFQTQAKTVFGEETAGTAIDISKEKFRALLPLLLVFLAAAVWLLTRWFRWLAGYSRIQLEKVKAESKRRYTLQLLPYAAGQLLPAALLFAVTLAACYGLAMLAMEPLRIFPEWIPESLGEYDSWISRFWDLAGSAARPVTVKTPELTEVQFYGNLILWGTLLLLLRAGKQVLAGLARRKEEA